MDKENFTTIKIIILPESRKSIIRIKLVKTTASCSCVCFEKPKFSLNFIDALIFDLLEVGCLHFCTLFQFQIQEMLISGLYPFHGLKYSSSE